MHSLLDQERESHLIGIELTVQHIGLKATTQIILTPYFHSKL
jgi:hypothetical protein